MSAPPCPGTSFPAHALPAGACFHAPGARGLPRTGKTGPFPHLRRSGLPHRAAARGAFPRVFRRPRGPRAGSPDPQPPETSFFPRPPFYHLAAAAVPRGAASLPRRATGTGERGNPLPCLLPEPPRHSPHKKPDVQPAPVVRSPHRTPRTEKPRRIPGGAGPAPFHEAHEQSYEPYPRGRGACPARERQGPSPISGAPGFPIARRPGALSRAFSGGAPQALFHRNRKISLSILFAFPISSFTL